MQRNRFRLGNKSLVVLLGVLVCSQASAGPAAAPDGSMMAESRLPVLIAELRSRLPLPPDQVLSSIRSASTMTFKKAWPALRKHPIEDVLLSPQQGFVVLVDNHGMVGVLPVRSAKGDFVIVSPGVSDSDFNARQAKLNEVTHFVMRGWDPPISRWDPDVVSGHERALMMGLDTYGRTILETPAMRWKLISGIGNDPIFDCTLLVLRKNYSGKSFVSGSEISSICRAGMAFTYKLVYSGVVGSAVMSPDTKWVALMTEEGLRIRGMDGATGPEKPDKSQFGRPAWLDAMTVVTFSIGKPARVYHLENQGSNDLAFKMTNTAPPVIGLHVSSCDQAADGGNGPVCIGPSGERYRWSSGDQAMIATS